jgi:nitrate reductase beta subunit
MTQVVVQFFLEMFLELHQELLVGDQKCQTTVEAETGIGASDIQNGVRCVPCVSYQGRFITPKTKRKEMDQNSFGKSGRP